MFITCYSIFTYGYVAMEYDFFGGGILKRVRRRWLRLRRQLLTSRIAAIEAAILKRRASFGGLNSDQVGLDVIERLRQLSHTNKQKLSLVSQKLKLLA